MARSIYFDTNAILPKGAITLREPLSVDGKLYYTIISEYFDIIRKVNSPVKENNNLHTKDWVWHIFDKQDKCIFSIDGDKVLDYIQDESLIKNIQGVLIVK